MSEAITIDVIHKAFRLARMNYAEPNSILVSPEQGRFLKISLRQCELSEDPLLFAAFCAGYELRRSAKVNITARVIKEFRAFCGEMARAQVEQFEAA